MVAWPGGFAQYLFSGETGKLGRVPDRRPSRGDVVPDREGTATVSPGIEENEGVRSEFGEVDEEAPGHDLTLLLVANTLYALPVLANGPIPRGRTTARS